MHINRKRTAKEIETIDLVIRYIESNRETAITRLFPGATEDYKQEWRDRNLFKFWTHLDSHNQHRVVLLALEHYE